MVYLYDFGHKIEKTKIFKRLHIDENAETLRIADDVFLELHKIIIGNMKLTVLYSIVNSFDLGYIELDNCEKYVMCFISSNDEIDNIVNHMMSSGDYFKGYLLNEMATDVIFNSSNEMNKAIKENSKKLGYKLTKRFAPGDGDIELKQLQIILDVLKKEVTIDAYLTEGYMIVPQKSLLYLYGLEKIYTCSALTKNGVGTYKNIGDLSMEDSCSDCSNLNCQYRDIK